MLLHTQTTTVKMLQLEPNKSIIFTIVLHVSGREVPSSGSQHYGPILRPCSWPEMCTSGPGKLNYDNNAFSCVEL